MSAMRRAAKGLVETRSEVFESRHGLEASQRRFAEAMAKLARADAVQFTPQWGQSEAGTPTLTARFAPPAKTQRFLKMLSIGMALLMAASLYAAISPQVTGAPAFLLPMIAVLAILGFPFLVLGMASAREADEARIAKAIRVALKDEDEKLPPRQRWADED